jgi:hypothetical protein
MNTTSSSYLSYVGDTLQNIASNVMFFFSFEAMRQRQEREMNGEASPFIKWLGIDTKISELIGWPKIVESFYNFVTLTYQAIMGLLAIIVIWFCVYILRIIWPPIHWFIASFFSGIKFFCRLYALRYERIRRKGNYQ